MMEKKTIFFRLAMSKYRGATKDLLIQAGVAVAAVTVTGQKVFAEVAIDQYGQVVTAFYTLNPEGVT